MFLVTSVYFPSSNFWFAREKEIYLFELFFNSLKKLKKSLFAIYFSSGPKICKFFNFRYSLCSQFIDKLIGLLTTNFVKTKLSSNITHTQIIYDIIQVLYKIINVMLRYAIYCLYTFLLLKNPLNTLLVYTLTNKKYACCSFLLDKYLCCTQILLN